MPLDTSIALNAKAPEFNPLQQALQVAQFRAYNANGLAQQQALAANRATSAAYQQAVDPNTGQLDTNKLSALIAADPDSAYNYATTMKNVMDARQAQQTYDKGQIGMNNDQIDNYKKAIGFLAQQFATLDPSDPNFNGKLLTIGADAAKLGHVDPNMVASTIQQVPQDPTQRAAWFQQKLASMKDAAGQLDSITAKPTQIDSGGSIMYKDTNPITNPSIVGTTINKTMDPVSASTPTPYYDRSTGESGNIPRSQFAVGGQPPPIPTVAQPANMPTSGGQAAPMPSGSAPGAPRGFVPTGPALGAAGIADDAGKRYGALTAAASTAKQVMGQYDNAASLISSTMKGKGSGGAIDAAAVLNSFGVPVGKDAVESRQLLSNYLNSATDQAAQALGMSGSDARLAAVKAGQPSADTMNGPALYKSIMHVKGLQQAVFEKHQAETAYLAANGNNTSKLNEWEAQWNKSFNPEVSYVRALNNPQEQEAAMQEMKARGKLGQWMEDYSAMKKMGAF
jgi:hypothetical protein